MDMVRVHLLVGNHLSCLKEGKRVRVMVFNITFNKYIVYVVAVSFILTETMLL